MAACRVLAVLTAPVKALRRAPSEIAYAREPLRVTKFGADSQSPRGSPKIPHGPGGAAEPKLEASIYNGKLRRSRAADTTLAESAEGKWIPKRKAWE